MYTTIERLLSLCIDVDVVDDVIDDYYCAFSGRAYLTAAGRDFFAPVLGLPVELLEDSDGLPQIAIINLPEDYKPARRLCKVLFNGLAGYISDERWHELFRDPGYYRDVNTGAVYEEEELRQQWLDYDGDKCDTWDEELDRLLTPWEEGVRQIPEELELDGELEKYIYKLIKGAQANELKTLELLVDTADGISWDTARELDDQIALRSYKLTH